MAFIGLDGTSEILLSAISATDTVLPISGAASVCVALGTNTSKFLISDGVYEEVVRVTGCLSGKPVVVRGQEGTVARSFIAGSCVAYKLTTATICDLISGGGCSASVSCVPLQVIAGLSFPDAFTGQQYAHAVAWSGSSPATITILQKPSWMSASVTGVTTGNSVVFSGLAGLASSGANVQFAITNCGGTYGYSQRIVYCGPVGAVV